MFVDGIDISLQTCREIGRVTAIRAGNGVEGLQVLLVGPVFSDFRYVPEVFLKGGPGMTHLSLLSGSIARPRRNPDYMVWREVGSRIQSTDPPDSFSNPHSNHRRSCPRSLQAPFPRA